MDQMLTKKSYQFERFKRSVSHHEISYQSCSASTPVCSNTCQYINHIISLAWRYSYCGIHGVKIRPQI